MDTESFSQPRSCLQLTPAGKGLPQWSVCGYINHIRGQASFPGVVDQSNQASFVHSCMCVCTHRHVFALISYFLSYWCFVCFEGGRRRKRERMNLGGKNLGGIGERERYTWKQLNKNKRKDVRSWEKRKQENEVLEGCQLDDVKPILGGSDINIYAKSVKRKLDLSTDPGEWLCFELLQQDPQGDTETGFFLYFHYCSLTRR